MFTWRRTGRCRRFCEPRPHRAGIFMITPDLLKILCCPETHQDLRVAEAAVVEKLNREIAAGSLRNRVGQQVTDKIDGGLIRGDGKFLYPIRQDIPVMLADEAIPLSP